MDRLIILLPLHQLGLVVRVRCRISAADLAVSVLCLYSVLSWLSGVIITADSKLIQRNPSSLRPDALLFSWIHNHAMPLSTGYNLAVTHPFSNAALTASYWRDNVGAITLGDVLASRTPRI